MFSVGNDQRSHILPEEKAQALAAEFAA